MCRRSLLGLLLSGALLALPGCRPSDEILLDDASNPHVQYGIDRVRSHDFDAAIASFERALKVNPQSVRSHYELGLIYERVKGDYVTALYHYNQVLKLQKTGWPTGNVNALVAGCRQQIARGEPLGPVTQHMQRELEALRKENEKLLQEVARLRAASSAPPAPGSPASSAPTAASRTRAASTPFTPFVSPRPTPVNPSQTSSPTRAAVPSAVASTGGTRYHRVRSGETLAAISRLYQVELPTLLAANPHIQPRTLTVGALVKIPGR